MKRLEIVYRSINEIKPYEKNPRKNRKAVEATAESIKEFGFKNPIILDKNNYIVAGHTRYEAVKILGIEIVPCIYADDLKPEQIKALRLADNKTAELAGWDFDLLAEEIKNIAEIDMSQFGFDINAIQGIGEGIDFSNLNKRTSEENTKEYKEFVEKFKPKKTTDDCFTPDCVYETIKNWVCEEYDIKEPTPIVRPFYPGGDYEKYAYPKDCVVIDNPPFSILAEIKRFYKSRSIKFFLFAPHLTLFSSQGGESYIITNASIIYENGANVNTSVVTNLENAKIRTAPELRKRLYEAQGNQKDPLPKYEYPVNVITSALLGKIAEVEFRIMKEACEFIRQLDSQKESGAALYGGGYLLSDSAAEAKAEAEKTAKIIIEKRLDEKNVMGGV